MAVKYIGSTTWQTIQMPLWTVDGWGVDHCVIMQAGPITSLDARTRLISSWVTLGSITFPKANISIPAYPAMWLAGYTTGKANASYATIEAHYVGFKSGSAPAVKYVNSKSIQSAQGQGMFDGQSVSGTVQYRAARTTWTWFTNTPPPEDAPSAYNFIKSTDGTPIPNPLSSGNVEGYSLSNFQTGIPINSVPLGELITVLNSIAIQEVVTDYEKELLVPDITGKTAGLLWACRTVVDQKQT